MRILIVGHGVVGKNLEKELQDLTDKRCKEVDELTAKKEQELMAV